MTTARIIKRHLHESGKLAKTRAKYGHREGRDVHVAAHRVFAMMFQPVGPLGIQAKGRG